MSTFFARGHDLSHSHNRSSHQDGTDATLTDNFRYEGTLGMTTGVFETQADVRSTRIAQFSESGLIGNQATGQGTRKSLNTERRDSSAGLEIRYPDK